MAHHLNAHVPRVFVRQQGIEIVDGAAQERAENGDGKFRSDQPPQAAWRRLMMGHDHNDLVDNELGDPQRDDRNQRSDEAKKQPKRNDQRA